MVNVQSTNSVRSQKSSRFDMIKSYYREYTYALVCENCQFAINNFVFILVGLIDDSCGIVGIGIVTIVVVVVVVVIV